MLHGDTKVSIGDVVVDCDNPNFGLIYKHPKALRHESTKTSKLENKNSFLKTTRGQQKHLLYVTTCSYEELVDISNTIPNKRFKLYPSKALEIFETSLRIA
jgi:hypothetical protein